MSGVASKPTRLPMILILSAMVLQGATDPPGAAAQAPSAELEEIAKAYRIEVIAESPKFPVTIQAGAIEGKAADRKELRDYTSLFVREFSLYPPALVERARLERVVLCRELSFAGQLRNAIPDFEHRTLYLDVSRGAYNKPYQRKVIHHEFFHIIDYLDDGELYKDDRWAALNPADFKYGEGGRAAQELRQTSVPTTKFPGFLNHYSTTGVEEDKAEMFAHLLVDPVYVEARAKEDRVLRVKVERMKELAAQFCPELDDKFWAKARSARQAGE